MKTIRVLDWLNSKHIALKAPDDLMIKVGEYVLFTVDGDPVEKMGLHVGFEVKTDITGKYNGILEGERKAKFETNQMKADQLFKIFEKDFTVEYQDARPVTARFNIQADTIYFFFYSEQRYQFTEFVKRFREKIGMKFFLYQVGARDMIRLSPGAKDWLVACGCGPLGCGGLGALPSIEMENVVLQNLEGRDVEKLKGWCGKLKCSLIYERDLYIQESQKFPKKGQEITINGQSAICIGYNILTNDILSKSTEGYVSSCKLNDVDGYEHSLLK